MASVVAVNWSKNKGEVKIPIDKGYFIENFGLEGDAHSGSWHRQVSLLGQESIKKMQDMGIKGLEPGKFAENITTEGIVLYKLPIGTILKIGDVVLEITQIGKECHEGCAIKKQVGKCVMPLEGVFAKVIKEGYISKGDSISLD